MKSPRYIGSYYGKIGYIILILFLCSIFNGQISATPEKKSCQIDSVIRFCYSLGEFSGVVLVAKREEIIFRRSYGHTGPDSSIACQPSTQFLIGSITKQFTAVMTLQLVEEGLLSLDKPIGDYVPKYTPDIDNNITLSHLLSNMSGLPHYEALSGEHLLKKHTVDQLINSYSKLKLKFAPGTDYLYSSVGFNIVGAAIENVTGKSFSENLMDRFFKPLGMKNTALATNRMVIGLGVQSYSNHNDKQIPAHFRDMSTAFAAGGICSNTDDLLKWNLALYSEELLSKKMMKRLISLSSPKGIQAADDSYCFGLMQREINLDAIKKTMLHHDGEILGFRALLAYIVEDEFTIIILQNIKSDSNYWIASQIINILYERPYSLYPGEYRRYFENKYVWGVIILAVLIAVVIPIIIRKKLIGGNYNKDHNL